MNRTQTNCKKQWYTRALSFLLCTIMVLGGVLPLLPPLSSFAATTSADQEVALAWKPGVETDLQGVRARPDRSGNKTTQITALVYIVGKYDYKGGYSIGNYDAHDVTVSVETFDISTRKNDGLYTVIDKQITLTNRTPYAEITIHVSAPARYTTAIGEENYTPEFGLRIKSIDEGKIADENRVLTSTVCTESSYVLALSSNSASGYYGQTNYLQKLWNGYVYSGMDGEQQKTDIPFSKSTLTERDDSASLADRLYPKDIVRTNENLAKLLLAYGGRTDGDGNPLLQIFINGNGYFSDNAIISVQGFHFNIYETWGPAPDQVSSIALSHYSVSTDSSKNWSGSLSAFNFFDYAEYGTPSASVGVSTLPGRSNYSSKNKYMRLSRNDHFLKMTIRNLSAYKKNLGTNHVQTLLAWNTAPYVTGYALADTTYAVGDYLYLQVRFSTHVQVENRDSDKPLILQAKIGDNSSPVDFTYYTGSYTDTLVFRTRLTKELADSLSSKTASSVTPVGFKNLAAGVDDGLNRVCDLFWSAEYNQNNIWNWKAENTELASYSDPLSCTIDVRTPSLAITGTLSNQIKTAHTVNFDVSGMTIKNAYGTTVAQGEVYYALSKSESSKGVSFTKFEGYNGAGSYSITEGSVTGEYYLFIRAVNAVGVQKTVRTETPLKFDNTAPQITALTSENYAQYKKSHAFSLSIADNTGGSDVQTVYLYVESENGTYKLEKHPVYVKDASGTPMTAVGGAYAITLTAGQETTDLVGLADDSYGRFRIGFLAEDKLGNVLTDVTWFYDTVPFDTRDTFVTNITTTPDKSVGSQELFYNDTSVNFSTTELQTGDILKVESVRKDGVIVFENGAFTTESHGIVTDLATISLAAVTGKPTAFAVDFKDTAVGRYEITLSKNDGAQSSNILLFYVTGKGENLPANYRAIWAEDRLLTNEVWQFATNKFYAYGSEPSYYGGVNVTSTPIFSDYAHAYAYAQVMEYTDLELLYFDENSASVLESFNNGTNNKYRKAAEDMDIPATEGQTWIRYKASTWQIGDNSTQSWVYYFYKEGKHTTVDVTALSASLRASMQRISEQIANKDDPNAKLILASCYGRVNANGEPLYAKEATFADPFELERGVNCTFSPAVTYIGDRAIYDSFITYDGKQMPLVANYTFTMDASSFLYYKLRDDAQATYTKVAPGMTLRSLLGGKSGVYEFAEFGAGAGYREYVAYCDFDEPILSYRIGNSGTISHLDAKLNNTTLRADRLTIFGIVNSASPDGNYRNELDRYAYVYLRRGKTSTAEDVVAYYSLAELNRNTDGILLPAGSYELGVCDRLGNKTVLQIRTNPEPPTITYAVRENTSVKFTISRSAAEILPGGFKVYFNGREETPTFANELTFVKSGTYRIEIQDIYGMSASCEYTFSRAYPSVEFAYKGADGGYKTLREGAETNGAFLQKTNGNLYYISAAADLRVSFDDVLCDYEFLEAPSAHTLRNGKLDIPIGEQSWVLKISYRNDPGTAVIITSAKDETPPSISAEAEFLSYTYHNESGGKDVLFDPATRTPLKRTLQNGDCVTSDRVMLTASDDTLLNTIYYVKDGGALEALDASLGSWEISGAGSYTVTAIDILGNKATFSFTLGKPLDFKWFIGDGQVAPVDPISHLAKDGTHVRYTLTTYTGKAVQLVLGNNLSVAFSYQNQVESGICTFTFEDGKIAYTGYDETLKIMVGGDPQPLQASGEILCGFLDVTYTYDGTYLTLLFAEPQVTLENLCIRVNDITGFDPYILQLERSNVSPTIPLVTEDGTEVRANASDFTGGNKVLTLDGTRFDADLLQVVAYRSLVHTSDFTSAEQIVLYRGGAVASLAESGFYKIVATNKYGNQTTCLVRISFGFNVDVETGYEAFDTQIYTYQMSGAHTFHTNKSLKVVLYSEEILLTATKAGAPYTPTTQVKNGSVQYIFSEIGVYNITIEDACENRVTLTVTVAAPTSLVYNNYLVGFNQNALWKDRYYTNAPLSLSRTAVEADHIAYVAYRKVGERTYTRLFDAISFEGLAFDKDRLLGEADGDYEVLFADIYGNTCIQTVHISRAESLSISRVTQNSAAKEQMSLANALTLGAWSNHILTLKNNALAYTFTVDGEVVSFAEDGTYSFTFPSALGEGEKRYNVSFVDAYGNTYTFAVVLYRKIPMATLNSAEPLISMNGKQYARTDFSYDWEGTNLTATYHFENGSTQAYHKGTALSVDGVYTIVFTDLAGNTDSRTIIRDSVVGMKMTSGKNTVYDGALTGSSVYIRANGDTITFVRVLLNGEEVSAPEDGIFTAYGQYEVLVQDAIGNSQTVRFDILNKYTKTADVTAPTGYALSQVWFYVDGFKISYVGNVVTNNAGNQVYRMDRDGTYEIDLLHLDTRTVTTLTFVVDNETPQAMLKGTEPNMTTRNDVSLSGLTKGDTVQIYRDGTLYATFVVDDLSKPPVLSEAGEYHVVVTDLAGNAVSYDFVRAFTTNTASNVFIILLLLLTAFGGLLLIRLKGKLRTK